MFANLFREMKLKKVSQDDIAKAISKTPTSVSRYMLGRSDFTYKQMVTIRDTFFKGLSLDYLFKKEEQNPNN